RGVAWREMRDRLDADASLDCTGGNHAAHPRAGARIVVDIDHVDLPRVLERSRHLEHRLWIRASRRIDLDRDHELAGGELALQVRLDPGFWRCDGELARA